MSKGLFENQPLLMISGAAFIVLFAILAMTSLFDSTQILGINRWIKPMKFAVSIAVFLFTLAVYLDFVNGEERAKKIIGYGSLALLVGEMVLITMQAARGTTSHFNIHTGMFNRLVFIAMGLMIAANTLLLIYLLVLYFRARIELPAAIVWGMRLGIILPILASFEGGVMIAFLQHTVGAADGGAGLPFVNWSTEAGDLRVAHFIGLHGFQAVPFLAYTLERCGVKFSVVWTFVFALAYFALFTGVLIQALFGKPFPAGF